MEAGTRTYAPPQAWPRPGAAFHLGWIPATPIEDPATHEAAGAHLPDAVRFAGEPLLAGHEEQRLPPDPAQARRPGMRWVRAADLLQQTGQGAAGGIARAAHEAYEHGRETSIPRKLREVLARRKSELGPEAEIPEPPITQTQGIYR